MASATDDLTTIRRLSQYRPFERGGAYARETKEDLILAAIAEAGGSCTSVSDCASTIETLWGLHYEALELGDAINHLMSEERVVRNSAGDFALSLDENQRLQDAAAASAAAQREAMDH